MGKNKIKLSYVNDGEPFTIPHMTVKAQELLYKDMAYIEKEKNYESGSVEFLRELNKYMILRVMQTVDDSITIENIENMHPDDYIELLTLINDGGRELTRNDAGKKQKTKK